MDKIVSPTYLFNTTENVLGSKKKMIRLQDILKSRIMYLETTLFEYI